jgi:hypothetical protein
MGKRGGRLQWSLLLRLGLCYVLVPPEVGPIVADPETLAVTPYQRDPL